MKLMVVESPNKIKKIAKVLGSGWVVKASVGHIRDLPLKRMGVDETTLKPEYEVIDGKQKVISNLKAAARDIDEVYLATDPDREGEAIAWHIMMVLGKGKTYYRVTFDSITEKTIKAAIQNPRTVDMNLVYAQEARRVLDRLVGYKDARKFNGLTKGRVQSPAVRLVAERELEIRQFKPENHFGVQLHFGKDDDAWSTELDVRKLMGDKLLQDPALAQEAANAAPVTVVSLDAQQKTRANPVPFTTSTLQQAASSQLKMSSKLTMQAAQKLFEEGLITYIRTDSPALSDEAIDMVRQYGQQNGLPLSTSANKAKAKGNAQEAHEAIRPVDMSMMDITSQVDARHQKLYKLIWVRTMQSQMALGIDEVTTLVLTDEKKKFVYKTSGTVVKQPGWRQLGGNKADNPLPSAIGRLKAGMAVEPVSGEVVKKQTQPPKRFTEATLIKELEKQGIGRPATYASIMSTIIERHKYVDVQSRMLHATDRGLLLHEILKDHFSFMELEYTRNVEARLDLVAEGKDTYLAVVREVDTTLNKEMTVFSGQAAASKLASARSIGRTPTPKMKQAVQTIAERKGIDLKKEDLVSFDFCKNFLDEHLKEGAGQLPPSQKMIDYAVSIADKLGLELPTDVKDQSEACKAFITKHKPAFDEKIKAEQSTRPPSEPMLNLAKKLASEKGAELTDEQQSSFSACKAYIDSILGDGKKGGKAKSKGSAQTKSRRATTRRAS